MIDAHRGAFEYDWRARLSLSLREVGRSMSWGEALRITRQLSLDPSSHVAAAVSGWAYPLSHDAIVLMNLFDLQHQVAWAQSGGKRRRPPPYPRPWETHDTKRAKPSAELTQDEIVAALRTAGHTAPLPAAR